jgi:CRP-like cAMP-binding protein
MKKDVFLQKLKGSWQLQNLPPGAKLINKGDLVPGVFYLDEGVLLIKPDDTGKAKLIRKDSFIGIHEVLNGQDSLYDVEVKEQSNVYYLPFKDFSRILEKEPVIRRFFIQYLSRHMEKTSFVFE